MQLTLPARRISVCRRHSSFAGASTARRYLPFADAPLGHQRCHPLEDCEVAFLLGGEEAEMVEEGNDVFVDFLEVVDLKEPDSIALVANRAALEMSLEKFQNGAILLGDVQAQRQLPGKLVVRSFTEA